MNHFNKKGRLLFFVHYNPYNGLSAYVLNWLECLRPYYSRIVFISNSKIQTDGLEQVRQLTDRIIFRKNVGFDFGAWKDAITSEGWDSIQQFDSLTLMNDSCFGPLFIMEDVFTRMENENVDFWGITNHPEIKNTFQFWKNKIEEHLQSYFLSFSNKVICSKEFVSFWEKVKQHRSIKKVILHYEVGLTKFLKSKGFKPGVYIDTTKEIGGHPNKAFVSPEIFLQRGLPFLKVKSLLLSSDPQYLMQRLKALSSYNISFIKKHFSQILLPNRTLEIFHEDYTHIAGSRNSEQSLTNAPRVAIHIHAYYLDSFRAILMHLSKSASNYDLLVTTDSEEKRKKIQDLLQNLFEESLSFRVFVFNNIGRNVLPWLKLSSELNKYEIVGHFHTKKSPTVESWVGDSWMRKILHDLIDPYYEIISLFSKDKRLGIVFHDIPSFFINTYFFDAWGNNKKMFSKLWERMGCKKNIEPDDIISPIMPYGMMLWYRPSALAPLTNLKVSDLSFEQEPLPIDGTLPHAIERLPVYVAWEQGFHCKVIVREERMFSGFSVFQNKTRDLTSLKGSITWRLGNGLLYVPKKLMIFFHLRSG